MSGRSVLETAKAMDVEGRYALMRTLITEGFFNSPVRSEEIVVRVSERFAKRWETGWVQVYLKKFMSAGVVHAVKTPGTRAHHYVLADVPRADALRQIAKGKGMHWVEQELFAPDLVARFKPAFEKEMAELHDNFGKNGNSTAFLLRKILEKLIIIVFAKHGRTSMLEDKSRPGGWVGLDAMIDRAVTEKIHGVPILLGKTAKEIKGIKFLGDAAAHNPLADVDMQTIIPQLPFIITAYKELAQRL